MGFVLLSISKIQTDAEVTLTGILIALVCSLFYGCYGVSMRYSLLGVDPLSVRRSTRWSGLPVC